MQHLKNLDKSNIWHPFTPLEGADEPLLVTSASGVYLNTDDGRKIIDAVSSWWVNLHGHANPDIADAIAQQARNVEHVIFAGFTHEPAIALSQKLLEMLPANQEKIFFSDDGSTAVEVAIKMAIQYWFNQGMDRKGIIALEGAYHGDTFGSMSVGDRNLFTTPFAPFLFQTQYAAFPGEGNEANALDQFTDLVRKHRPGIFIFEPLVQGAAGMRIYNADVLDRMIGVARDHDVITIADEVFTGFGRTGKLFASDYLANKPDIIAVSKGITGGALPLGVTSCSGRIVSAFRTDELEKTFFHGHSYTANPLACAAANASAKILTSAGCRENISRISAKQRRFALHIQSKAGVRSARSLGTILSIELDTAGTTGYTNNARKKIYNFFLERDILLRPLGNVVYVLPPYIISDDELDYIYRSISELLDSM